MLLPAPRIDRRLLDEEKRRADVDGEQPVEVFDRRLFNGRGFGNAGISNQDVEAIADDGADLLGELVRAVRGGEIRRRRIGTSAKTADFVTIVSASVRLLL